MVLHQFINELKKRYGNKLTYEKLKTMYAIYYGPYNFSGKNSKGVVWPYYRKGKKGNLVHLRPIPSIRERYKKSGWLWRNTRGYITTYLNEGTFNEILQCVDEIINFLE